MPLLYRCNRRNGRASEKVRLYYNGGKNNMTTRELNRDQLDELKNAYFWGEDTAHIPKFDHLGQPALFAGDIPDSVISIGDYAFYNCVSLKTINFNEGLLLIGKGAFNSCTALESIILPNSLKALAPHAFGSCTSLKSVKLPESLKVIPEAAFAKCEALNSIEFPESIYEIERFAFNGCKSLKKVVLPKAMTQLDPCVFPGCSSLTEIVIPEGLTKLGAGSFDYCRSLTDIYCYSVEPPFIYQAFDGIALEQVTAHVPVVKKYKKDTLWKAFGKLVPIQ